MSKGFKDDGRRFEPPAHDGHIGPGPKPGPRRAVNLSVDAEILRVAKEMKINLSRALEDALRKATEEERIRRFQEAHRAQVESYNRLIERAGVFGEELLDLDDDPAV